MTVDTAARRTSVSRVVAFDAATVFAVVSDASLHSVIDGSGTVRGNGGKAEPLHLGSRFGMKMHIFVPYKMTNEVVEFEQDELIAWQHLGKHRWRFELESVEGGTKVTETFDWSTSLRPSVIEALGYPKRHEANIERTLAQLDAYLTNRANSL